MKRGFLSLIFATVGCVNIPAMDHQTPNTAGSVRPTSTFAELVPVADHHMHLIGPYAVMADPPLPEVTLPPELERLLAQRARLFGSLPDVAAVSEVYTDNALVLDGQIDLRWMTEKERIALYFTLFRGYSTRFVPASFSMSTDTAFVAGTVVIAPDGDRVMNFNLGLVRAPDGQWRIATESTTKSKPPPAPVTADQLIASMDRAGIARALVLSTGYYLGGAGPDTTPRLVPVNDKVQAVQLENDWFASEVARFPERLAMACGVNPMEDYAIAEMARCKQMPQVRAVEMKVGEHGDRIDLTDAGDLAKLRRFFSAANDHRMPIVIHLGSAGEFGRTEVRNFLNEVVSAAPDIPVQIAHMGFHSVEALSEFADARAGGDPLTRNLYFDFSIGSFADLNPATATFIAESIRKIGLENVLYASDELPGDHNPPTYEHWPAMRRSLPMTDVEFTKIANNLAPYLR